MKLVIVDGEEDVDELGVFTMRMDEFAMKECQPFIATQKWDEVRIDLTEKTPLGIIRQVIRSHKVIPRFDKENITLRVMKLLCEVCVDESAKLRALYASDIDSFYTFVQELGDRRGWWQGGNVHGVS